jgi:DegV family protein with EDD domain
MAENRPYKLYSDSTADLSEDLLREMDVSIVKLSFEMNGKTYCDGDMSMETFYKKLREGAVSKTAQIPPSTYEEVFEKEIQAGYDILYMGFSSGLSGSYNSSCIARDNLMEKYPQAKIICIDSLCASTGEGLLLYKADEKKKSGMDIDELAKWIEATKLHLCHVFTGNSSLTLQNINIVHLLSTTLLMFKFCLLLL